MDCISFWGHVTWENKLLISLRSCAYAHQTAKGASIRTKCNAQCAIAVERTCKHAHRAIKRLLLINSRNCT
eukprot:1154416-Pelagomonas_calceolata.AAC.2